MSGFNKARAKKFLSRNMLPISIAFSAALLSIIYVSTRHGYSDDGDQLALVMASSDLKSTDSNYGGSSASPKDMTIVASKTNAMPKGVSKKDGKFVNPYGGPFEMLAKGMYFEVVYSGLSRADCLHAAENENKKAASISINNYSIVSTYKAKLISDKECNLESNNVVMWFVR